MNWSAGSDVVSRAQAAANSAATTPKYCFIILPFGCLLNSRKTGDHLYLEVGKTLNILNLYIGESVHQQPLPAFVWKAGHDFHMKIRETVDHLHLNVRKTVHDLHIAVERKPVKGTGVLVKPRRFTVSRVGGHDGHGRKYGPNAALKG